MESKIRVRCGYNVGCLIVNHLRRESGQQKEMLQPVFHDFPSGCARCGAVYYFEAGVDDSN